MKQILQWKSWMAMHEVRQRWGYKSEYAKIPVTRWRDSASRLVNMTLLQTWFNEIVPIIFIKHEADIAHFFYETE